MADITNTLDIKNIINKTDDIAFIIGNGIHRYTDSIKDIDMHVSWEEMLISLSKEQYDKIPLGISNTEFFDILELRKWKKKKDEKRLWYLNNLDNFNIDNRLKGVNRLKGDKLFSYVSNRNANRNINRQKEEDNIKQIGSFNYNTYSNQKIEESLSKLKVTVRNFLSEYNFPNIDDIPEIDRFHIVNNIIADDYLKFSHRNDTKKDIQSKIKDWGTNIITRKIVSRIQKLDTPLLTTNYDDVLSKSINAQFKILDSKILDKYPWNCYYGDDDDIKSPTSGFGIWHINGMVKYPISIKIGLEDYMDCVSRAHKMLHGAGESVFDDVFHNKYQYNWVGQNTWLHIFFNKSLFIFGLGLEENEVFLRWLLIQREKYFSWYGSEHKGWYVHVKKLPDDKNEGSFKDNEIDEGKRMFLESVGFKIIEIEDCKTIYEDVW